MSKFKTLPSIRVQKATDSFRDTVVDGLLPSPDEKVRAEPSGQPGVSQWVCHIVLATGQAAFTVGSVYLKSSMRYMDASKGEVFSPITYVFFREIFAAPIMLAIAYISTRTLPKRRDCPQILLLGLCLFLNQLFFILGIDLSGVVVATCMQPTIPVFTVLLAVVFGMERVSVQKVVGISLAVAGSISMVLGGASGNEKVPAKSRDMVIGNLCLLANTLAMAFYFLSTKLLVAKYPPVCISAWAYVGASVLMGITAGLVLERNSWSLPPVLVGPLIYWVLIVSVVGYYVVAWGSHYLPASQVAAFVCLQPFLGTLLAFTVLGEKPSIWDLGAFGILFGLLLVTLEKAEKSDRPAASQIMSRIHLLMSQSGLPALGKPEKQ